MTTLELNWRSFQSLSSAAEAAACSAHCVFSLVTLEIASYCGGAGYALIERKQPDAWRWAIVDANGQMIDDGWESTQMDAKLASEAALRMELV